MKIVLLSPAHPLRGGIAASSERLAQELVAQGHDVVIHSFRLQYPALLFPGKTQYSDPGEPGPPELAIKTHLNSINPLNWLLSGLRLANERPDRVIVRFWLPFMGPCLGTVLRVARVFARNKFRATGLVDNIVPHERRFGDRPFAWYFVRACDDFVVMSHAVGAEIRQFLPRYTSPVPDDLDPVRYAPHPVYDNYGEPVDQAEARQALGLPENVPLVLFFGFIRAYKGLDLLLEALALAPGVQAIVAGESYEAWEPYQDIIARHGLAGRVHLFTDFIAAERVRYFFSAADLVVQPYKTATQSGISQIAYHFDKPMVVTQVGGLPEIVTDGVSGYVVAPQAAAIAAAMRDFFDHGRAEVLQAGVRAEKARFSWAQLVRAVLDKN